MKSNDACVRVVQLFWLLLVAESSPPGSVLDTNERSCPNERHDFPTLRRKILQKKRPNDLLAGEDSTVFFPTKRLILADVVAIKQGASIRGRTYAWLDLGTEVPLWCTLSVSTMYSAVGWYRRRGKRNARAKHFSLCFFAHSSHQPSQDTPPD